MEAEDYKTLLRQAEDELGTTPGAYCSRKVAVRAMELLREEGKRQYDEDMFGLIRQIQLRDKDTAADKQVIQRQAQAIQELQNKSPVRLGSGLDPPAKLVWADTKEGFREPRYISNLDPISKDVTREEWYKLGRELDEAERRKQMMSRPQAPKESFFFQDTRTGPTLENNMSDYFADLFGQPELLKRENWNSKEEPLSQIFIMKGRRIGLTHAANAIRDAWERDTNDPNSSAYGMPVPGDTIDIDYEEVN